MRMGEADSYHHMPCGSENVYALPRRISTSFGCKHPCVRALPSYLKKIFGLMSILPVVTGDLPKYIRGNILLSLQ